MKKLAGQICKEHEAVGTAIRGALEHARRCGELLCEAKTAVPHGQWLPWLEANCSEISEQTARRYMRIACRWNELRAKTPRVSDLTLRGALSLLDKPRDERPTEPWHWMNAMGDLKELVQREIDAWPAEALPLAPKALRDLADALDLELEKAVETARAS